MLNILLTVLRILFYVGGIVPAGAVVVYIHRRRKLEERLLKIQIDEETRRSKLAADREDKQWRRSQLIQRFPNLDRYITAEMFNNIDISQVIVVPQLPDPDSEAIQKLLRSGTVFMLESEYCSILKGGSIDEYFAWFHHLFVCGVPFWGKIGISTRNRIYYPIAEIWSDEYLAHMNSDADGNDVMVANLNLDRFYDRLSDMYSVNLATTLINPLYRYLAGEQNLRWTQNLAVTTQAGS